MPSIIVVPDKKKGKGKGQSDDDQNLKVHGKVFYETEIEKNRQDPIPSNAKGYGKEPFTPGSGRKPATNVEGRRLTNEWNYGVTYITP